jgi:hypothetical protein
VEYQVFTSVFKCYRRGIPIFINKNKIEIHFSRLFSNATEVESLVFTSVGEPTWNPFTYNVSGLYVGSRTDVESSFHPKWNPKSVLVTVELWQIYGGFYLTIVQWFLLLALPESLSYTSPDLSILPHCSERYECINSKISLWVYK